jgi:hypothetical protein
MISTFSTRQCGVVGTASLIVAAYVWSADSSIQPTSSAKEKKASASQADEGGAAAVAKAREKAKLMHSIYAATLDAMHHHFFRNDRAVLPARALEDVFAEMEVQSRVKTKWISVNTKAMSVSHEPKSEFEKKAAVAIAAGKGEFELVEDGYYQRAAAIPLRSGCVNCHSGFFAKAAKTQRFAGLVISVPINKDAPKK